MTQEQIFIQALMHCGIVSDQMMRVMCKNIFVNDNNEVQYYVTKINKKLEALGMGIKSANCELTGAKYWTITSTVLPELENFNYDHKPFLEFTKVELKFLSKIFGDIIGSNTGYISSIDCINSVGELQEHFSHSQADAFIKTMTQKMWLSQKDGNIYLGVRSIAEFLPLFKAKYKENFETCSLCKLAVFFGQNCGTCEIKFHAYCLARILKMSSNAKCLNCKSVLTMPSLFSDDSVDLEDQPTLYDEPRPSTSRRSQRIR